MSFSNYSLCFFALPSVALATCLASSGQPPITPHTPCLGSKMTAAAQPPHHSLTGSHTSPKPIIKSRTGNTIGLSRSGPTPGAGGRIISTQHTQLNVEQQGIPREVVWDNGRDGSWGGVSGCPVIEHIIFFSASLIWYLPLPCCLTC